MAEAVRRPGAVLAIEIALAHRGLSVVFDSAIDRPGEAREGRRNLFEDPIATGWTNLAVREAVELGRDARRQAARDADRDRTFGLVLRHAVSDYRMRRVAGLKLGQASGAKATRQSATA